MFLGAVAFGPGIPLTDNLRSRHAGRHDQDVDCKLTNRPLKRGNLTRLSDCAVEACVATGRSHGAGTPKGLGYWLGPHSRQSGRSRPASTTSPVRGSTDASGTEAPP